jgi:hypothetical protein
MANWLDKYEQGGMVLKKKTKDNYGKRPNPNDVQASVGPDFVGLGYNTKGRDYSPAWGGQFQDGGKLTLPEAIVYGHKDPSTKAYFDKVRTDAEKWQDEYYWNTPTAGYNALEQMHSKYGAPKINTIREKDTAWYNPITDSMNISIPKYGDEYGNPVEDLFLHELAHKVQANKKGNVGFVKDFVGKDLINTLKNVDSSDMFTKKGWLDAYGKNYNTPGTVENEAHSVIAPKLEEEYRDIRSKQYDRLYGDMAMGGALPGAVGFTYARTQDPAPDNGKYAKKTKASAQNGSVIKDDRGQLAYPGEITEIGSNDITMQGVDYPVLGVSDTGDTQMMYPDQDYKFDGEKVTEFPMAQNGRNIPTTADSTRLYNSQMALNKFYENEMKAGRLKMNNIATIFDFNNYSGLDKDLRKENLDFYRNQILRRSNKLYTFDDLYKKIFNLSPEQVSKLENKGLGQTKGSSEYQDYYRDLITPMQNLASPFALIDKRIAPQRRISYSPKSSDYPGGEVSVYDYDPILIKPVNMLTPEERALRIKKYGKDSGIKETVSKPIQKPVSKPIPKSEPKSEPAPVVAQQATPEKPTHQPKSLYEYEGEQVMAPVPSGGGAAMVGVRKKDGTIEYIKPEDYQRMSVPKYGQDYIKSKQKMQGGGWLDKYPEPMRQDATRVAPPVLKLTDEEKLANVAKSDQAQKRALNTAKEVISERQKNKATKGDLNTPGSWKVEEKARLFPSSVGGVGEMVDEYINPATYVGVLADALGESVAARDPKGIATSLGLSAIGGGLGLDPLGGGIKAVKTLTKQLPNAAKYTLGSMYKTYNENIYPILNKEKLAPYADKIAKLNEMNAATKESLKSGELRKRLINQGLTEEEVSNMKVPNLAFFADNKSPGTSYSRYQDANKSLKLEGININFDQLNRLKDNGISLEAAYEHEVGHFLQRPLADKNPLNDLNKYNELLKNYKKDVRIYKKEGKNLSNTFGLDKNKISKGDERERMRFLSRAMKEKDEAAVNWFDRKPQLPERPNYEAELDKKVRDLNFDNENSFLNYFNKNHEAYPFLREMRQTMVDEGFIKDKYQDINKDAISNFLNSKTKNRLKETLSRKEKESNTDMLHTLLKTLPAVAPAVIASQSQEKKNGGWLNKYK